MTDHPTPDAREAALRRYCRWAGRPDGTPENVSHCAAQVPVGGRSVLSRQCSRPRGHGTDGLLCRQHAKRQQDGHYVRIPEATHD